MVTQFDTLIADRFTKAELVALLMLRRDEKQSTEIGIDRAAQSRALNRIREEVKKNQSRKMVVGG